MSFTLSLEQQRAVNHRGSHLLIIACAGSGKTETVARRCVSLLEEGMSPESIVAFTFTERAATELKQRISERVSESMGAHALDRLNRMFVGTIHAFCLRLLQEHVPQYAAYDIIDEHQLAGLVSREFDNLGLKSLSNAGHWDTIALFLDNLNVVENELLSYDQLGEAFRDYYRSFSELLQRYRLLTYGQLITLAVRELTKPDVHARVHGAIRHLIVDEYQDINPAQEQLIRLLSQDPVTLTVVGDDLQAIYQWRGSTVENILTFDHRYEGVKAETLPTNRRSRPGIVNAAEVFSEAISPKLPKLMQPYREPSNPEVVCSVSATPWDEAETIAGAIASAIKQGYRCEDFAVLVRSVKTSSDPFVKAFQEYAIPFRCGGRTGLFRQPEARVLGKTYAWLVNGDWRDDRHAFEVVNVTLEDLMTEYSQVFALSAEGMKRLRTFLNDWKAEVSIEQSHNLVREFYQLLNVLQVQQWETNHPSTSARLGVLARFTQLLADYESVNRRAKQSPDAGGQVNGQSWGQWYYKGLYLYMQTYALEAYEDFSGENPLDYDAVDILTVHQAKGLEWPVVFLPCLSTHRFPSMRTGTRKEWLLPDSVFDRLRYEGTEMDERRLFYVAMTRARDVLYLSTFERINREVAPSPFFMELSGGGLPALSGFPLPPQKEQEREREEPKPTISFSQLAQYDTCPFAFRLRDLLGFQPPIAQEIGYGRALHHVLRRIVDHTKVEGAVPAEEDIGQIMDEEFYLPYANRPGYKRMRGAAERIVLDYIRNYRDDLLRIWQVERPFELHLDKATVIGRADAILNFEGNQTGKTALIDYKTSLAADTLELHAFQLCIYTCAGRLEGLDIEAAYVHDLTQGKRLSVPVSESHTEKARLRAEDIAEGMRANKYVHRSGSHCRHCDVRWICKYGTK